MTWDTFRGYGAELQIWGWRSCGLLKCLQLEPRRPSGEKNNQGRTQEPGTQQSCLFLQFSFNSIDCEPVTSVIFFKLIRFSHASTNINISWNWSIWSSWSNLLAWSVHSICSLIVLFNVNVSISGNDTDVSSLIFWY